MRPNTPHAVYTIEPSICLGGHFYAAATIRDTCIGIFQTFIAGFVITNASLFSASRNIFIRMAILFEQSLVEELSRNPNDGEFISTIYKINTPNKINS